MAHEMTKAESEAEVHSTDESVCGSRYSVMTSRIIDAHRFV